MSNQKLKAMISQPMNGLSEEEIQKVRLKAIEDLEEKGYEVVSTYFDDEWANKDNMVNRGVRQIPVAFLAKSLEHMALCDAVYFCDGWEKARGCRIENQVAKAYGLTIIYPSGLVVNHDDE